ncbi:MAG: bacterial transcriptional activator domain-containing protein [Caldilineaceae bacterium]|nr:bacterial transcriptional activator domain-containing protein [Caldilineaceae bacterium]
MPGSISLATIDDLLEGNPAYPGSEAPLRVQTLGGFRSWRFGEEIAPTAWGREKATHLFQFFLTLRRRYLHKEQIVDRLWPDLDMDRGDRDFKVALNSINKALEPDRQAWSEAQFVRRHGLAYGLNLEAVWLDTEVFDLLSATGNQALLQTPPDRDLAVRCFEAAIGLYHGDFLPERRYEDWSSAERERLQVLALNTMTELAELLLEQAPLESLRLTQRVLAIDPVWEDAYRVQMRAFMSQQNRPLALRTYERCVAALAEEFDVPPLPETTALYRKIMAAGD